VSARDDDGSEIIALARKVGLAGVAPAATTAANPASELASTKPGDDGAEVVALARQYGVAGFSRTDK
jgi:hypothetical protein